LAIVFFDYHDFLDRWLLLTRKLPNQGLLVFKLKSSPRKCYGRHYHDLVNRYRISVSQMITGMFFLSYSQSHALLSGLEQT
jgi:hypothetical protein